MIGRVRYIKFFDMCQFSINRPPEIVVAVVVVIAVTHD